MITHFDSLQEFTKVYKKHINDNDEIEVSAEAYKQICQSLRLFSQQHIIDECDAVHPDGLTFRGISIKIVNDQTKN